MADSFLHRGAARRHRTRDATHSARNRSFRSSAEINKANIITPHAAEISTRGSAGRRTDRRRHRGILHIHDLYAEVSQAFSRPQRRSDHIGDRQLARFWDDPSADLWRDLGPRRPQMATYRLRRHRRLVHSPAVDDSADRQRTIRSAYLDRGALADPV